MNINNLFSGILGFVIGLAMVFLFWIPMTDLISGITDVDSTLGIFLNVIWISLCFVIALIVPVALSTTDDRGN